MTRFPYLPGDSHVSCVCMHVRVCVCAYVSECVCVCVRARILSVVCLFRRSIGVGVLFLTVLPGVSLYVCVTKGKNQANISHFINLSPSSSAKCASCSGEVYEFACLRKL